jgi:hypothetical protein
LELLPQFLKSPNQERSHSAVASAHQPGDFGDGMTTEVVQLHGLALVRRQPGERLSQAEQLLVAHGLLAGRGLIGGEPGFEPG